MIRILFTGDRFHDDAALIANGLDRAADGRDQVTLVHGRCNPRNANGDPVTWDVALAEPWRGPFRGGDWLAHHVALARGWTIEAVPAQWEVYGPKVAGGIRNQQMVNRGASILVAAPVPGRSKGTYDCIRRAKAAGIPVVDLSQPPEPEGLW